MLRSIFSPTISYHVGDSFIPLHQIVRWKRKPRKPIWLGTARSKMFKIIDEPVLPPEERAEILRLHANYKTSIKTIRQYFAAQQLEAIEAQSYQATEEDIRESLAVNDAWNAECAQVRKERMERLEEEEIMKAEYALNKTKERTERINKKIEDIVRNEKMESKNFVTAQNLDEKIDECIATEVDFNYAIDLDGNMYTGYEGDMEASLLDVNITSRPRHRPQPKT